jgi:hypothetical protein
VDTDAILALLTAIAAALRAFYAYRRTALRAERRRRLAQAPAERHR